MTKKPGKSRAKGRPKGGAHARTKARVSAKRAGKRRPIKTLPRDPLDAFIAAAAAALDLPVEPQWRPAIKANLGVILRQAALVADFALPDDAEPAPVFEA